MKYIWKIIIYKNKSNYHTFLLKLCSNFFYLTFENIYSEAIEYLRLLYKFKKISIFIFYLQNISLKMCILFFLISFICPFTFQWNLLLLFLIISCIYVRAIELKVGRIMIQDGHTISVVLPLRSIQHLNSVCLFCAILLFLYSIMA